MTRTNALLLALALTSACATTNLSTHATRNRDYTAGPMPNVHRRCSASGA